VNGDPPSAPASPAATDAPDTKPTTGAPAPPVDRDALFAAGPTPIPRKAVVIALCAVLVLGLGGTFLEHVLSREGLNPTAARTAHPVVPPLLPSSSGSPPVHPGPQPVTASLQAFMGLTWMDPAPAPRIALVDQDGRPVSLGQLHGSVVVVSFFDGPCNDICPVLADEIHQADVLLGPTSADVDFVTVNTDPDALAASDLAPAAAAGLGAMTNWHILTGPLPTLNSVWRTYGITITTDSATGTVAHNDLLYFIDAAGRLRYRATPFADEQPNGTYSLPAASVRRWALGIATYARDLAGNP